MQTAPADSTCSHSGILTCGAARDTTATTSGARANRPNSSACALSSRSGVSSSRIIRAMRPARARAAPSNTTNRQGASLPWSGTREATARIVSSSSAVGPGPVMTAGGAERRRLSRAIVSFMALPLHGRAELYSIRAGCASPSIRLIGAARAGAPGAAGETRGYAENRTNRDGLDGAGAACGAERGRARRSARRRRPGDPQPVGSPQRPDGADDRRRALAGLLRQDGRGRLACAGRRIRTWPSRP